MLKPPLVSVIIPNYNHARFLEQRIASVINQTFQDFELIILDDTSTDNSLEVIARYAGNPKITVIIVNEFNSGNTFKQWQKGLELAKGKYIWIAESDDYADPDLLLTLVTPFLVHDRLLISYCQSAIVDGNGSFIRLLDWADALNNTKWKSDYVEDAMLESEKYLSFRNTIPNASAVVFKKPADPDILQESLELRLSGDWLFWRKILHANGQIAFFAKPYNYFRLHDYTTRAATTKGKELLRIKEHTKMIVPSLLSPFNDRYDWMISMWFQNRKALKGSIQYFIPNFPMVLLFRLWLMFSKNIVRKMLK